MIETIKKTVAACRKYAETGFLYNSWQGASTGFQAARTETLPRFHFRYCYIILNVIHRAEGIAIQAFALKKWFTECFIMKE